MPNPPTISAKTLQRMHDSELKKPASMWLRTLAFLADSLVACLLSFIVLKFVLSAFYGAEFEAFTNGYEKLWSSYLSLSSGTGISKNSQEFASQFTAFFSDENVSTISNVASTITFFASLFYFTFSEYFTRGASFGKKIFRIRVASQSTGTPPLFLQSLSRSIWRACMIAPSGLIAIIVLINAHVPFFTYRHRGWHDKLSRTEVVDDK